MMILTGRMMLHGQKLAIPASLHGPFTCSLGFLTSEIDYRRKKVSQVIKYSVLTHGPSISLYLNSIMRLAVLPTIGLAALTNAIPFTSSNPAAVLLRPRVEPPATLACSASSWPPITIGTVNEPQPPSADLESILAQVDPANIENTIRTLVSFGTRHTLSTQNSSTRGIGAARNWIHAEFQKYASASDGRLSVNAVGYLQEPDGNRILFPTYIHDVLATLQGTEDNSNRLYVVSGHYDSRVSDPNNYEDDAPGADDDASGVAVSLELARIMSQPRYPRPKASIAFVAVAGEEQGLYGAQFLAQMYANATPRVNVSQPHLNLRQAHPLEQVAVKLI